MRLADSTWPEVAGLDREKTLVLAPIAACEQHSRHLPTFTDTILCGAVADGVEAQMPDRVLLLPVLWLGASDHHLPFGATLTLSVTTHIQALRELVSPFLDDGFKRLLILNGHGGNIDTLHVALRLLQPRYPNCLMAGGSYWEIANAELAKLATGPRKEVGHACEIETALMMHLRPDLVRTDQIRDDGHFPPAVLSGVYLAEDFGQRTSRGAYGYPSAATPELGKAFLEAAVARVVQVCKHLADQTITLGRQPKH